MRGLIFCYCSTRQLIGQPEQERLPEMWVWVIIKSQVKVLKTQREARKCTFWFEGDGAAEATPIVLPVLVGQHVALLPCRLSCVWGWTQASFLQTEIQMSARWQTHQGLIWATLGTCRSVTLYRLKVMSCHKVDDQNSEVIPLMERMNVWHLHNPGKNVPSSQAWPQF